MESTTPSGDTSTELASSTKSSFYIGTDSSKNFFTGHIDEIRFWERWLHPSEAPRLYEMEKPVDPGSIRPVITSSPQALTVAEGEAASFTVEAIAYPDPSYKWEKMYDRKWQTVKGGNSATLTLPSAKLADATSYRVTVSNSAGAAISRPAKLLVLQKPAIVQQPQDTGILLGKGGTIYAEVSGSAKLVYEWFKDGSSLGISNANSWSFDKDATQAKHGGTYSYKATNDVGEAISQDFTVSIISGVEITADPVSSGILSGQPGLLSVTATGGGSLTYQWEKYDLNTKAYTAIAGATGDTLSIASMSSRDSGKYRVIVSNGPSSLTSKVVDLEMYVAPTFKTHPRATSLDLGGTTSLTALALGEPTPDYQWQMFNTVSSQWEDLPKMNKDELRLGRVSRDNAGKYRVIATNPGGTAISNEASITVYYAPILTTELQSTTVNEGEDATLTVAAEAFDKKGTDITYRWFFGRTELKDGTGISGAKTASLQLTAVDPTRNGSYYCILSNTIGETKARSAKLAVIQKPYTLKALADKTIPENKALSLVASVLGSKPMTYQWYKDGSPIKNANMTKLYFSNVLTRDSGQYTFEATNAAGSLSMSMVLTVTSSQISSANIVAGADVLTADADPDNDGLANLIEHALGSDPADPDSTYAPAIDIVDDGSGETFFSFHFTENKLASDVITIVEQSTDLQTWEPIDLNEAAVSTIDRGDLNETTVYIPTSSGARFFRIRVEK